MMKNPARILQDQLGQIWGFYSHWSMKLISGKMPKFCQRQMTRKRLIMLPLWPTELIMAGTSAKPWIPWGLGKE